MSVRGWMEDKGQGTGEGGDEYIRYVMDRESSVARINAKCTYCELFDNAMKSHHQYLCHDDERFELT